MKTGREQKQENTECPVWNALKGIESPFKWAPDIMILKGSDKKLQENIIDHLSKKEKEFSQAKKNVFREIVVHLVLAYERVLEDHLVEAMKDIVHCHNLLDCTNLQEFEQSDVQELEGNSNKHEYYFSEIKQRRQNFFINLSPKVIQEPSLSNHDTINQFIDTDKMSNVADCTISNPTTLSKASYQLSSRASGDNIKVDAAAAICLGNNCMELKKAEERKSALEYVVCSILAHVAYFSGNYKDSYKIAKTLEKKYEKFGDAGKATLLAVKGAMILEYGYSGNVLGLEFMKKAVQMDPDHWEWNLLCGKVMGRIRRVEEWNGKKPTAEEMGYLQRSIELHREDASVLVHLANVYRSLSHFLHKESLEAENKKKPVMESRPHVKRGGRTGWLVYWRPQVEEELDVLERWHNPQQIPASQSIASLDLDQKNYLELAKNLYLEALELEPNCPYNNARCAKGLWSMPNPFRDKNRAQEAIFKAIFLAPQDTLVNHYAGLFYEYCYDYEKALECYERAFHGEKNNYPAELNYINLKLKTSCPGSYNPLFHLGSLLIKYTNPAQTLQTMCHQGFYCYKIEEQYFLAIRYIAEAIKINPRSQTLKTFYPGNYYGQIPPSYNMFDLIEEIARKCRSLPEAVEKDFVDKTLETIRKLRAEVLDEK